MANKISVLLVDDHSLVRRGFRRILEDEPDIEVMMDRTMARINMTITNAPPMEPPMCTILAMTRATPMPL